MRMMGCGDVSSFNSVETFRGRRLRPIIPRLSTTIGGGGSTLAATNTAMASAWSSCFSSGVHGLEGTHFPFHNLSMCSRVPEKQGKMEATAPQQSSSRWNPTKEQLRALEDLYDRGIRTPTSQQIQHITSQLRRFGKIEGKNVFYWFQNHKARERQKRRRQIEEESSGKKDDSAAAGSSSGGGGAGVGEESKSWGSPINFRITANGTVPTTEEISSSSSVKWRAQPWLQTHPEPLFLQKHPQQSSPSTWKKIAPLQQHRHRPSDPPPSCMLTCNSTSSTSSYPSFQEEEKCKETLTLELFPLRGEGDVPVEKATSVPSSVLPAPTKPFPPPHQPFFQFLPLKN